MKNDNDELMNRVIAFKTFSLPGQTMVSHMGTVYLVNDLATEVKRLRDALTKVLSMHDSNVHSEYDGCLDETVGYMLSRADFARALLTTKDST